MKLSELVTEKGPYSPSDIDKKSKELTLPSAYKNVNYGKEGKVQRRKASIKDTNSGKVYTQKTFHTKVMEGGNIFKGEGGTPTTQRINKGDVDPTLQWLERITGLPLIDNKLGTTGKKPTSGDIDVAVDESRVDKNQLIDVLRRWVDERYSQDDPREWIAKSGTSVHFKTPINGDPSNGFVQTDFMFGDPEWMKFSLKGSDVDDSPFKGKHTHILMNSIAKANGLKWSYTRGLVSRQTDNLIARDPDQIAEVLLGPTADREDLNSVESILNKIKDMPKYEELVADAREAFRKQGLEIPARMAESMYILRELYYNKPQEVDIILNMIDEVYGTEKYDKIIQLLKKNKVNTETPDDMYQDLLKSEESDIHRMMKAVKKVVKGQHET